LSALLDLPPFGQRDDGTLLREMNDLTRFHREGCPLYARIHPEHKAVDSLEALPYLHVGLFKRFDLRTDGDAVRHTRVLSSSATTSGIASRIALDQQGSALQSRATESVYRDTLGAFAGAPLLVLDHSSALRKPGVSARLAAALSLRAMASEFHFLLREPDVPESINWEVVGDLLSRHGRALVYGFTWMLWRAWAASPPPAEVLSTLGASPLAFVHSGGWKRMESLQVSRGAFDEALLRHAAPGSSVTDFYGLVEQPGMIYPLDPSGLRRVPVWGAVIARDPVSLRPVLDAPGQLQLLNPLARGGPYHSVLTEDMGIVPSVPPDGGEPGSVFELIGRIPNAEVRGCANV
jgi:hypothetical protein